MARIVTEDHAMQTCDGIHLATDLTVADDGAAHPSLLIRTPYGRSSARATYDHVALARLGWAVVVQDVRGRWDSPGQFQPFVAERADGAAAVAWCRNQPWSNGQVAMAGASYVGMTQWLAAAEHPEGLRGIAPTVTVPDIGGDAVFPSAVFAQGTFSGWALGVASVGSRLDPSLVERARAELDRWPSVLEQPLDETVVAELTADGTAWLSPQNQQMWDPLNVRPELSRLDLAAYHLAGWHDIFCEGNLDAYAALTDAERPDSVRHRQRLVVGPWAHGTVLRRTTGDLDFGIGADGQINGVPEEQIGFLTAAVHGAEVTSGARVFVMGSNRWIDLAGWPPPTMSYALYLGAGGSLSERPAESTATDHWRHDPTDPVPTVGGRTLHPVPPSAGPLEQSAVEARSDVAVYTSEPLASNVTVLGLVRAEVMFGSTAEHADLTVKLVDVYPDGRAMLVVDGISRTQLTPGVATEVTVDVGSTGMTFAAGHRIRVELASSSYPKYDLCDKADQTVHHGGRAASRIVLPTYQLA